MTKDVEELKQKLNRDTGKIRWSALNQYQQEDAIITVSKQLDLIAVASEFVNDNSGQVSGWIEQEKIGKISLEVAQNWEQEDPELWALVVSPWVLVQEIG